MEGNQVRQFNQVRQLSAPDPGEVSLCIRVYGIVQGVGFRPFVSRIADRHGIRGSVCNKGPYVEILARAGRPEMNAFLDDLEHRPPERAVILKIDREEPAEPVPGDSFRIIESAKEEGEIFVSPDIATCPKCREELFDPKNRRYLHPFINCTACGPRVTILDGMPYDRERTSMKEFPMCPQCEYEYTHAETRRYDAQPVCCHDCGPRVYLLHTGAKPDAPSETVTPEGPAAGGKQKPELPADVAQMPDSETDARAITAARRVIASGGIVAVKGIGGFHLCCDATNETAVARLRRLKHRPQKPFAVMMKNLLTVERECEVLPGQEEILDGHQKPILLLKKKAGGKMATGQEQASGTAGNRRLAPSVAPGNPTVGVMLPYAPVQMLLFRYDDDVTMPDCLVMTSGNVSGAPICRDDADALTELGPMCDLILSHNRKIRLRCDDSVMDFFEGRPYMIRRSRGYAPLPFLLDNECRGTVLAVGGELKNTFCIAKHRLFYPSPYVGDMADIRTVRALKESVRRMEHLLEAEPEIAACDLHPRYNTTVFAESLGLPLIRVQHHYAHILSCMAENDCVSGEVLGAAYDGTGFGTDGTIWGGEILRASADGFTRCASIRPFLQIGGDASAREGWRIAVSMLYGILKTPERTRDAVFRLGLCDERNLKVQLAMADRRLNGVTSTSAGRLFDAVSAILGIRRASTFEGEASMALEFAAEEYEDAGGAGAAKKYEDADGAGAAKKYRDTGGADASGPGRSSAESAAGSPEVCAGTGFDRAPEDGRRILPTEEIVREIVRRRLAGEAPGRLAWLFHRRLADMTVSALCEIREETGLETAALSGGVFQNRLFLRMCAESLRAQGFHVLLHSMVPPNDGGIALGQAVAAMHALNREKEV